MDQYRREQFPMQAPAALGTPKDKTTAILLAVFLSLWTWVYTYKVDAWKFWMNLALTILTLGIWGLVVAWPWSIIDAARRNDWWYQQFPNGDAIAPVSVPAGGVPVAQRIPAAPPAGQAPLAQSDPISAGTRQSSRAGGRWPNRPERRFLRTFRSERPASFAAGR